MSVTLKLAGSTAFIVFPAVTATLTPLTSTDGLVFALFSIISANFWAVIVTLIEPAKSLKKPGSVTVTEGLEPKLDPRVTLPLGFHKTFWESVDEKLESLVWSME